MIDPLLSKDIMAFVNAYKGSGGCFKNSNARDSGTKEDHV
jgi:hypothetical protein